MAEVYGEKPKKFTREWWPYFWLYYKWHTIIGIVAIAGIIMGIYQKVSEIKYDVNLTYMAQAQYIGENGEKVLTDALLPFVEDVNGDGEKHLYINEIVISGKPEQTYMDVDLRTKHDLEFGDPYSYLYIYDAKEIEIMELSYDLAEMFLPVETWCDKEGTEVYIGNDNVAYGVSLKDSKIFKECMLGDSEDFYVFVKNDAIDEEKNDISRKNAITLAKELIK